MASREEQHALSEMMKNSLKEPLLEKKDLFLNALITVLLLLLYCYCY